MKYELDEKKRSARGKVLLANRKKNKTGKSDYSLFDYHGEDFKEEDEDLKE